jgi:formylglycine-generating enzyme
MNYQQIRGVMRRSYAGHRNLFIMLSYLGAGWLGFACSNLLGISEPIPRDVQAGGSGAGTGGTVSSQAGNDGGDDELGGAGAGSGGEPSSASGMGGEGGYAGTAPLVQAGSGGEGGGEPSDVPCAAPATKCSGNEVQRCESGAWVDDQACAAYCVAGACVNPPSCGQLGERTCGDTVSCCRALVVPGGGFFRDYDNKTYTSQHYSATVSSFLMDRFEVTVGRLAGFVNVYDQVTRKAGDGKSPHMAGGVGWEESYPMPADSLELRSQLMCPDTSWDDQENGDLNLPANCVSFYVAYAFCIWDGGRLPTEAEWNYAAAGGDEQREYPWSVPSDIGLDPDHAYYGQTSGPPIDVGMKPKGNGRWGHSDLSGNVNEWTLDYFAQVYPSTECDDCVNSAILPTRSIRGGAFRFNAGAQRVGSRTSDLPDQRHSFTGFRCVRDLLSTTKN